MTRKLSLVLLVSLLVLSMYALSCSSTPTPTATTSGPATTAAKTTAATTTAAKTTVPAGQKVKWVFCSPTTSVAKANAGAHFVLDEMEKRTNGRFTSTRYYGNTLVVQEQFQDAMKAGILDICTIATSQAPAKFPINYMVSLPYVTGKNRAQTVSAAGEWEQLPEPKAELAAYNAMFICGHSMGESDWIGNKRVTTTADLKGVRINAGDIAMQGPILQKYGAVMSAIPSTEQYDALSKGTFDLVMSTDGAFQAYTLKDISKYFIKVKFTGGFGIFVCRIGAYNALPDDMKETFNQVLKDAALQNAYTFDDADSGLEQECKDKGLEIIEWPQAETDKFAADAKILNWAPYITKVTTEKGLPMQRMFDSWTTILKKYEGAKYNASDYVLVNNLWWRMKSTFGPSPTNWNPAG